MTLSLFPQYIEIKWTDYSSLADLRKFIIDILKIDKAFIDEVQLNNNELVLCKAITVMSKTLGMEVVA